MKKNWPSYSEKCIELINERCRSSRVFDYKFEKDVRKFENNLIQKYGSKYAVSFNSGTNALAAILFALKLGDKDKVLIPNFAFPGTVSPFLYLNCQLDLYDVDWRGCVNLEKLEDQLRKDKYKVLIVTHLWGQANCIESLSFLMKKYDCELVEDCSHAHNSYSENMTPLGRFGVASFFSASAYKHISGGHAGYALTDSLDIHSSLLVHSHYGERTKNTISEECNVEIGAGYNSRCPNISAILANDHLENIEEISMIKRRNTLSFYEKYKDDEDLELLNIECNNLTLYGIPLKAVSKKKYKCVLEEGGEMFVRPTVKNVVKNSNKLYLESVEGLICIHPAIGYM